MKYMVQFNQYASQVGYGDNSLRHAFYRGLCTRIKDDMAHHGKPNNLRDMRFLAQELDARYWTRRTEISRENRESKSSGSYSNNLNPRVQLQFQFLDFWIGSKVFRFQFLGIRFQPKALC